MYLDRDEVAAVLQHIRDLELARTELIESEEHLMSELDDALEDIRKLEEAKGRNFIESRFVD